MSRQQSVVSKQFVRFSAAGAVGTGTHYAVLIVLVHRFEMDPVIASMIGAFVGAIFNYLLNYHFTFQSTKRHREALAKFLVVAASGFVLNALVMYLLVNLVELYYLISQVLATLVVLFWNFIGNRVWSFREK